MAQIKKDMHSHKRTLSGDTEASQLSRRDNKRHSRPSTPQRKSRYAQSEDKENSPDLAFHTSTKSSTTFFARPSPRRSPRKLLHRSDAADKIDRKLADKMSDIAIMDIPAHQVITVNAIPHVPAISVTHIRSIDDEPLVPTTGPPPPYPTSSLRSGVNGDLNRFVSSSTASGTTLTTGSAPSFTKHAGPAQMRRIAPEDIPMLPERVGKMVFDKGMMKWVKATALATAGLLEEDQRGNDGGTEESDDPFRDIESLREEDSRSREVNVEVVEQIDVDKAMSVIEEHPSMEDDEVELTTFSFDDASGVVEVMTGVETEDMGGFDETTDSEDEVGPAFGNVTDESQESAFDTEDELNPEPVQSTIPLPAVIVPPVGNSTPLPNHRVSSTPIRSALKSASATPVSALKDAYQYKETPTTRTHRRSVSFSDGKRDGPIRGLQKNTKHDEAVKQTPGNSESVFVPSARSKRIAAMMEAEEDSGKSNQSQSLHRSLSVLSFRFR
jgi:hypothetical protein